MYEGQFQHGVFHGYGRLFYGITKNNEQFYIGNFETGLRHGDGYIQYQDGTSAEGLFEENELQEFEEVDSDEERKHDDKKEKELLEVIAPLRKEEIQELIMGRIADGIRQNFVLRRTKRAIQFDKMRGLYVPYDCRDQFYHLVNSNTWRYIIYKIDDVDKDSVEVQKCGNRESSFEEMVENLTDGGPRWIVFDLEYEIKEYGMAFQKKKLLFINYVPDNTEETAQKTLIVFKKDLFRQRMVYRTGISQNLMEYTARDKRDMKVDLIIKKM